MSGPWTLAQPKLWAARSSGLQGTWGNHKPRRDMERVVDKHCNLQPLVGQFRGFSLRGFLRCPSRTEHLVPIAIISLLTRHYCFFSFSCSFTCPFWIHLLNKLPTPKSLDRSLLWREPQLKERSRPIEILLKEGPTPRINQFLTNKYVFTLLLIFFFFCA